jgi:DNA invertase Pin-like site-specific DNA recombinase
MAEIGAYIRVSDQKLTDEGLRRQDINRQKEKIRNYCKNNQLQEPIFFSDDALSAFKDDYSNRPEFVKLLHEVKANRVKHIIVEDMTRWSRRIEDGLRTLKEVTEKAKVTSLAEGELGVTIPEQWFKTAIGFLMAEWSSRITAYKVKSGMDKRLKDDSKKCKVCGNIHQGRVPDACKKGQGKIIKENNPIITSLHKVNLNSMRKEEKTK